VLAVHCGLREGELLALRWEDVYLEAVRPTMLVRRTLTRGEEGRGWVVGASTKSGKGRRVRLTRPAVTALKITASASSKRGCAGRALAGSGPRLRRRDRLSNQPLEPA
jgi:integrase